LRFGHSVRNPGVYLSAVTKLIRLGEQGSVAEIIRILAAEAREWRAALTLR